MIILSGALLDGVYLYNANLKTAKPVAIKPIIGHRKSIICISIIFTYYYNMKYYYSLALFY